MPLERKLLLQRKHILRPIFKHYLTKMLTIYILQQLHWLINKIDMNVFTQYKIKIMIKIQYMYVGIYYYKYKIVGYTRQKAFFKEINTPKMLL